MQTLKYLLLGLFTAGTIHLLMNASCLEQDSPTTPSNPNKVDIAKIKESASKVEQIFIAQDTAQLATILTPSSLEQYREVFKDIMPGMKSYGESFKNRELTYYSELYAEYKFSEGTQTYTVAFAKVDDGTWKLIRI